MIGKVVVKNVILKNHMDENLVSVGYITPDQIHQTTVDTIADSGAIEVGLPQRIIDELNLPFLNEATARLADGTKRSVKIYDDLTVYIDDRTALVRGVASENENAPILLGQIVLKQIDYVIDCRNQKITPNPESEPGMMTIEMY